MTYSCSLLFRPKCRTTHFEVLNDINHLSDHSTKRDKSCCMMFLSASLLTLPYSFVSSANFTMELMRLESRSLMKMAKRTGPKTDPRGTPLDTAFQADLYPSIQTRCLLPCNHSCIQAKTFPPIPCFSSLSNNRWCGTLSNAFAKSK